MTSEAMRSVDSQAGTLGTVLQDVRRFLPRELVGDREWERILECAGALPAAGMARGCGFEFRLDDPSPAADFFVVVEPQEALAQYYIEQGTAAGTPATGAAAALARHLALMDPFRRDSVAGWTDGMTLEYDVAKVARNRCPAPGVFLRIRQRRDAKRREPHPCDPVIAAAGIAAAVGWNRNAEEERAVERAFRALPTGGEVAHIGALPGRRAARAVRLLVQRIGWSDIPAYLESVRWPGSVSSVVSALGVLADLDRRFRLSVDLSAHGTGPRLGVEVFVGADWSPVDDWLRTDIRDWKPVVARLEAGANCLAEKASGLRAWPRIERLYGPEGVHLLYMGINHVKLLIGDGREARWKAYTGLYCGRTEPRALSTARNGDPGNCGNGEP